MAIAMVPHWRDSTFQHQLGTLAAMVKRQVIPDWRRALELLADSAGGCTEALLFAHGFTTTTIAGLVDTGLVAVTAERVLAGQCNGADVTRFMITGRGRAALKRVRVPVVPNERGRLLAHRRD
jgi:hypothetical protein